VGLTPREDARAEVVDDINHTGYSSDDAVSASPALRAGDLPPGLNSSAGALFALVVASERVRVSDLADALVARYGVSRERALVDVATFVQRGQEAGILSYHQMHRNRVRGRARFLRDLFLVPVRGAMFLPSVQRRYRPYSGLRLLADSAAAQAQLAVLTVLVCLVPLSLISGLWSDVGAAFVVGFSLGVVGGLVVLGVAHEATHALVSTSLGSPPRAVYRQGMRVGLHRMRLSPGRDLAVAVSGPLLGALLGAALLFVLLSVDRAEPSTMSRAALIGLLIATSFQVACLVPPAADGTVIMSSLGRLRKQRRAAEAGT